MNGGCEAASAAIFNLPVAHHTKTFEGVWVRELCAIKKKRRQKTSRPGVVAHNLKPLGVYCQGLLLGVNSHFVKHSLSVFRPSLQPS